MQSATEAKKFSRNVTTMLDVVEHVMEYAGISAHTQRYRIHNLMFSFLLTLIRFACAHCTIISIFYFDRVGFPLQE